MRIIRVRKSSYWLTGNKPYIVLKFVLRGNYPEWGAKPRKEKVATMSVFAPRNKDVDQIKDYLTSLGYKAATFHGKDVERPETNPALQEIDFICTSQVIIYNGEVSRVFGDIREFAKNTGKKIMYRYPCPDRRLYIIA